MQLHSKARFGAATAATLALAAIAWTGQPRNAAESDAGVATCAYILTARNTSNVEFFLYLGISTVERPTSLLHRRKFLDMQNYRLGAGNNHMYRWVRVSGKCKIKRMWRIRYRKGSKTGLSKTFLTNGFGPFTRNGEQLLEMGDAKNW